MGTNETQMVLALALLDSEEIRCRHLFVIVPSLIVSVFSLIIHECFSVVNILPIWRDAQVFAAAMAAMSHANLPQSPALFSWEFAAMAACTIWVCLPSGNLT